MTDQLAINAAENSSKFTGKKSKKDLRSYEKIPVWICEYHQEVLSYIYRAIGSKHLPFSGLTMLHFDSHPDLMAPPHFKADAVYQKELLFDVLSIADWILPAVYVGHIRKVIWVKPPWSYQISDKTLVFHVGRHKIDGTIRVSCYEEYFCEDGLYSPLEELENCKELTVVVMTMLQFHSNGALTVEASELLQDCNHKQDRYKSESTHGDKSLFSSVNCLNRGKHTAVFCCEYFIRELKLNLEEPYILDIDMDFFSTLNPFRSMFTEDEFKVLRSFYVFPSCKSDTEEVMREASRRHRQNVQGLEKTVCCLQQSDGAVQDKGNAEKLINLEFLEFLKKWRDCHNKAVDYEMVHSAGMTSNLPVHDTSDADIVKMIDELESVLISLPKPTVITIARSSDDDYTPQYSVELIQSLLIKSLRNSYNENVEVFLEYKDQ